MADFFAQPCTIISGVGEKIANKLLKLGISTIFDLMYHLPIRYENRQQLVKLNGLVVGRAVVFNGIIQTVEKQKKYIKVIIADDTGLIPLIFFQHRSLKVIYQLGEEVVGFGTPQFWGNSLVFVHPELYFRSFDPKEDLGIFPIYRLTNGLTQKFLRKIIRDTLIRLDKTKVEEHLPISCLNYLQLPTLKNMLKNLHFPSSWSINWRTTPAYQRLLYEELVVESRIMQRSEPKLKFNLPMQWDNKVYQDFIAKLPFNLTLDQQRVIEEIRQDFIKPRAMKRILQGEVGAGKTVVAAIFLNMTARNGKQGILIVPSVLLAQQHYRNFKSWFPELKITFLGGNLKAAAKKKLYQEIYEEAQIVIGTHAILEDSVRFKELGLIVIDEQHRFGVAQRLKILTKSEVEVHQLMMSATPIPRSLIITLLGGVDCSRLLAKPAKRIPTVTLLFGQKREKVLIDRIVAYCATGQQVYWVCPMIIQDGGDAELANVQERFIVLKQESNLKVAFLHGKLANSEKERTMKDFLNHEFDILVTTTIIEVGIEVKNANLIIIENPERLGLVQIHQLRGRVGRSEAPGYCILFHGDNLSELAKQRLLLLKGNYDGWDLAKQDLLLRGPGEFSGLCQSGYGAFKFLDPLVDQEICSKFFKEKELFLKEDAIILRLLERWLGSLKNFKK